MKKRIELVRQEITYSAGTTRNNVFSGYDVKKRIELTRTKKTYPAEKEVREEITDPTEKVLRYEITDENRRAANSGYDIRARLEVEDPVDLESLHGMQQPPNLRE